MLGVIPGQTALHSAVKNHVTNVKVLDTTKMLLENGVDLRVKDKNGDTALHLAVAKHCDPELTKVIHLAMKGGIFIYTCVNNLFAKLLAQAITLF